MQYVQIIFAGNHEVVYDFMTALELQVDDYVVCDTSRGYSVGRVKGFVEKSNKAKAWIVQKVDVTAHEQRLEREKLKRKMAARAQKLEEEARIRRLAQEDEELRVMLGYYDDLQP